MLNPLTLKQLIFVEIVLYLSSSSRGASNRLVPLAVSTQNGC